MLSGRKSKVRDLSGRRLRKSFSMSVFLFGRRAAAASRLERRSRQAPEKGLLMRIHSTENSEEPDWLRRLNIPAPFNFYYCRHGIIMAPGIRLNLFTTPCRAKTYI
jgi:hypothetical protein